MTTESPRPRDVRMRGFTGRSDLGTALEWVDAQTQALAGESVPLQAAHGRVLVDDVVAPRNVPPFDRSAMDGYAVRGAETNGASDYNPLAFPVAGESLPGRPFRGEVAAGQTVRIMTGAPLPRETDAVVPAEYARESEGKVEITTAVAPGKHVGRTGEDIPSGTTVLPAGRRLRPQDVGVLASLGFAEVTVVRCPRIRLLVTGNELVQPGGRLNEFQIFESNSSMLSGLAARDGGAIAAVRLVEDDRDAIRRALVEPGADVILVSGGSSVGAEDHAPSIVAEAGELAIHGIAMRPSSPTGLGRIGESLVFLLPGNPVSCLCAYDFFAGRAIRRLGGRRSDWPYVSRRVTVGRKIVSAVGRVDYCRVCLNEGRIEPLAVSGASMLSSTVRADGFIVVPAELEGYAPGTEVEMFLYDATG